MKKISFVLVFLMSFVLVTNAQDIILKRNGEEIQVKVEEIGLNDVKYKLFGNESEGAFTLLQSEIFSIKYENGERELFEETTKTNDVPVQNITPTQPEIRNQPVVEKERQQSAQTETDENVIDRKTMYLGAGVGFDYGFIGGKFEFLPTKHVGLFVGLGYNLLSLGWNLGATYKFTPEKKVSPNLILMYGYNAAFKGEDSYTERYNMTSYGLTLGVNVDIKSGNKGNKWSIGLFLPIRSSKFMDNYDDAKNDSNVEIKEDLMPIGVSIGYNFNL
jgi:hypothetical protein